MTTISTIMNESPSGFPLFYRRPRRPCASVGCLSFFLSLSTVRCPLSTDHYTQRSTCHDTNHSSWTVSFSLARFTLHSIAIILMDISITILAGGCTKVLAHCLCHQVVFSFFFALCPSDNSLSEKVSNYRQHHRHNSTAPDDLTRISSSFFCPIPCNGQLALTRRVCRHSSAQTGERSCSLAQFSTSCQTPCPPE